MSFKIHESESVYRSANHSIYACNYHVIWCTKYRRGVLSCEIQERVKELIDEQQEIYDYQVIAVETMPDHIHLLLSVPPHISVASVVGKIKGYTSRTLRKEFPVLNKRLPTLWTRSKFIASTGGVTLDVLKQYVENQKGV